MKNFLTILLGILCIAVVVYGRSYWNERIEAAPENESVKTEEQVSAAMAADSKENMGVLDEELLSFTSNWPVTAKDRFKQTLQKKKAFKLLFIGSPAIGSDTVGTYPIVKDKLNETFGETIQVGIKTYNSTSTQVVKNQKQKEIAAENADLIIFEPFMLLNNGYVVTENALHDINTIMDAVKAKNPSVTFILQPSYPLYKAKIYPKQVAELKTFAEENQITYLDHWSVWPDSDTEAMKEYLSPDQSAPSEKGYQVWSDYLLKFLINKGKSN